MKQGKINLGLVTATLLMGSTALMAGGDIVPAEEPIKEDVVKRTLNGNMTLNYKVLPGEVDNIHDLFSEGIFYGRLRIQYILLGMGQSRIIWSKKWKR